MKYINYLKQYSLVPKNKTDISFHTHTYLYLYLFPFLQQFLKRILCICSLSVPAIYRVLNIFCHLSSSLPPHQIRNAFWRSITELLGSHIVVTVPLRSSFSWHLCQLTNSSYHYSFFFIIFFAFSNNVFMHFMYSNKVFMY